MAQEFLIGVDGEGRLQFINNGELDFLDELGDRETKRASHVEPDSFTFRLVFHYLRRKFGEQGQVAEWTRSWKCLWRVDMRPSGGQILDGRWVNRQDALAAEVRWLETNVL